ELVGQTDAAMRRRMSRQWAAVQRDPRPGDPLHVGHVRVVIEIRVVLRLLLNNAENAGGRLTSSLAARYRRPQDPTARVIDRDPLIAQRNNGHDRLPRGLRLDGLAPPFPPPPSSPPLRPPPPHPS